MHRIEAITSLITPSAVFADIGCDHGYVARFVLKSGLADRVLAVDKSKNSLLKAQKLLAEFNGVEFICADGRDLAKFNITLACIAGMGGIEIAEIVSAITPKRLVLCPHTKTDRLKQTLSELNYKITQELLIKDAKKEYSIFAAERII